MCGGRGGRGQGKAEWRLLGAACPLSPWCAPPPPPPPPLLHPLTCRAPFIVWAAIVLLTYGISIVLLRSSIKPVGGREGGHGMLLSQGCMLQLAAPALPASPLTCCKHQPRHQPARVSLPLLPPLALPVAQVTDLAAAQKLHYYTSRLVSWRARRSGLLLHCHCVCDSALQPPSCRLASTFPPPPPPTHTPHPTPPPRRYTRLRSWRLCQLPLRLQRFLQSALRAVHAASLPACLPASTFLPCLRITRPPTHPCTNQPTIAPLPRPGCWTRSNQWLSTVRACYMAARRLA